MWHSSPPTPGVAEVLDHVVGPLVGLGQQHAVRVEPVHLGPDPPQVLVGLLEVLAVGALARVQVRHRVQPEAVDAEVEPEPQHLQHRVLDQRVLVVQVGLVVEEPVPVVLAAYRVERPVRLLGVDEDDPRVLVLVVGVRPHVEVAERPVRVRPGRLEPRVLVAGVVHDQVGDDPDAALVRLLDQFDEVADRAEVGQDGREVCDVVPAVAQRGVVDRQQPDAVDAQPLEVVEPGDEAAQVAGAVAVGVVEPADQDLVEDGMLVPLRVARLVEGEGVRHRLVGSRDARQEGHRRRGGAVRRCFRLCHGELLLILTFPAVFSGGLLGANHTGINGVSRLRRPGPALTSTVLSPHCA